MPVPDLGPDPDPDAVPALPAWAERELAERRAFWAALRDGGAVTAGEERAAIEREVRGDGR